MEEQCPTCKVTEVKAQIADFGPALQEKIETALLRNPNANGMALSYDDLMTTGGSAAVMASGRNDSLAVIAGSGFPANVELIRKGQGQDAGFAYDMGYETWAAADMINRLLAGEEQGPSGVGIAVFDAENGLRPRARHGRSISITSPSTRRCGAFPDIARAGDVPRRRPPLDS